MPELPEVETLKRELAKLLIGKTIDHLTIKIPKLVAPTSPKSLASKVHGKHIATIERRAKVLILTLSDTNHLLIHLKMTGQLIYVPAQGNIVFGGHPQPGGLDNLPNKYTHITFKFTDGSHLYFNDMRRFGWLRYHTPEEKELVFQETGVEPLSKQFTYPVFTDILGRYPRRNLKQLFLDQTLIAGLGNIYVDESCFLANVLPTRLAGSLTTSEKKKLHQAIIEVLKLSIQKKGTSAHNYVRTDGTKGGFVPYLNVYGREKLSCKRCGTPIKKIKFAGRGTHFCPNCQK